MEKKNLSEILNLLLEFAICVLMGFLVVKFFLSPWILGLYKNYYIVETYKSASFTNTINLNGGALSGASTENISLSGDQLSKLNENTLKYMQINGSGDKILLLNKNGNEIGMTYLTYEKTIDTLYVYGHNGPTKNYVGNYLYYNLKIGDKIDIADVLDKTSNFKIVDVMDVAVDNIDDIKIPSKYPIVIFTCHPDTSKKRRVFLVE